MITSFRQQKTVVQFALWFVVVAFILTIFLVWGMGDKVANSNYIMKINGQSIYFSEYNSALENTRNYMRSIFGDAFDSLAQDGEIEKQVISDLQDKYLLVQKAEEYGITVSDDELLAIITSLPSFQIDGQFHRDTYLAMLAGSRVTPAQFEESLKTERIAEKMREVLGSSVAVSDEEVAKEYNYKNTQASVSYVSLHADDFIHLIKPTDEALQAYYNQNLEKYRTPKLIKLNYTYFDPAEFTPSAVVTDQDVENYYNFNKDQFNLPEQVNASHILIKVDDWHNTASAKAAEEKAASILKELQAGLKFSDAAVKYSADSSAANGGSLGWFTRGQMVPEFENAAFALNAGETSGIVKSMYGYHIIKVDEKSTSQSISLDEAKDEIRRALTVQAAQGEYREFVFNRYTAVVRASNLTAYNAESDTKLPIRETGFFAATDIVEPISGNPTTIDRLFRLGKSEVSQVETINNVSYIFEIADVKESRIPEFEEVRQAVTVDYVNAEAVKLAYAKAEEAMNATSIQAVSQELSLNYTTTPKFVRVQQIPGIGMNLDLNDAVFNTEVGKFITKPFVNGSNVYIVFVNDITAPSPDELKDYADMIKNELFVVKSNAAIKAFLDNLKSTAKIEISPFYEYLFQ
jgi:peptidyl-prolyl cis-trans isomerase D